MFFHLDVQRHSKKQHAQRLVPIIPIGFRDRIPSSGSSTSWGKSANRTGGFPLLFFPSLLTNLSPQYPDSSSSASGVHSFPVTAVILLWISPPRSQVALLSYNQILGLCTCFKASFKFFSQGRRQQQGLRKM